MKHRKYRAVTFNNKKKVFNLVYTSGLEIECPYSGLFINNKVVEVGLDKETGNHCFYFVLEDGEKHYITHDQPLYVVKNPDYIRHDTLCNVTIKLQNIMELRKISKREVARRLKTSVTQVNRLLDQTNYNKDLSRLIQMAAVLGYEFELSFKKAA